MLIEEVTGRRLILEFNNSQFKQMVNDIVLRLRMSDIKVVKVEDFIGEIDKAIPEIHLDPHDSELRNKISEILRDNKWAEMNADVINLVDPNMAQVDTDKKVEPEDDEKELKKKATKIAAKNVRDDQDNIGIEL